MGGWHSLPLSWRSAAASLEVTICITVRAESLEYLHLQLLSPEPLPLCVPEPLPHPVLSLPGVAVGDQWGEATDPLYPWKGDWN